MATLQELLQKTAELHHHLCPRQVLGVRAGVLAARLLQVELPQKNKRVLAIVETDGCFVDGVAVAANCWVGRRTMFVRDYGKVAVTFVDTGVAGRTGANAQTADNLVDDELTRTWRISPAPGARQAASHYAPEADNEWEAMLHGYQRMPDEELLLWQEVNLVTPASQVVSRPGQRAICSVCREEIMNEREVVRKGEILCRSCAGQSYYMISTQKTTPTLR